MKRLKIEKALTFIEPGPVTLVTTFDGKKNNVMTISWTAALDFAQRVALITGPWNHSFKALLKTKECVVCIPGADMLETAVKIGACSGADTDKFKKLGLRALPASVVRAPLVDGCLAYLECTVEDYMEAYGIFVLRARRVWLNEDCKDPRLVHAAGDGTFTADGEKFNFRAFMREKLPPGL